MTEYDKALLRKEILQETSQCHSSRARYLEEVTGTYDTEVYLPALRKVQEKCGEVGHLWNEKGLDRMATHTLYYCSVCGKNKKEPIDILVVRSKKRNKGSFFG